MSPLRNNAGDGGAKDTVSMKILTSELQRTEPVVCHRRELAESNAHFDFGAAASFR